MTNALTQHTSSDDEADDQKSTAFNRNAWDKIASSGRWFDAVDDKAIEKAREGEWSIRLTGTRSIPREWLGEVEGKKILCLAGGGGHQGPLLAAAGANVTVLDLSVEQLKIDQRIAKRHGLTLKSIAGDMRDLSHFEPEAFDLIVNPCSLNFCPSVGSVWREAFRVTRISGRLIAGIINPVNYLFDAESLAAGRFLVRHKIPYSDFDLSPEEVDRTIGPERPIEFGHSLGDLLGGQMEAGFAMIGLIEDRWGGDDVLSDHIATFLATCAFKPSKNKSQL